MGRGEADKLKQLFFAVCEAAPDERSRIVDEWCAQNPALRADVEALLAADAASSDRDRFLEEPALGPVLSRDALRDLAGPPTPAIVGGFEILRTLGEGGMGVVYEARQKHPRRLVALKMIRPGVATRQVIERFRREADVLARLRHIGIAQIYEAGLTGDVDPPQPYFAMELIVGVPLDEFAQARGLDERERLSLVARVCEAVQHAHDRGVIHRDLKPSNILVDETGQPKVLDFGVSRAVDADARTLTVHTTPGQLIGTIPYMSPEQVTGHQEQVDALSDVYSLGVICYELLAGRLPYDLRNRPIPDAVRVIQEVDPSRLSSINRVFRGDIETIVAKALEKQKSRRYQSAGEMAADIRRFLADQPLVARPASTFYQLRKFARRNKAIVVGALGIVLALTIGLLGMWRFATAETRQRHLADRRHETSQRLAYRLSINSAAQALMEHQLEPARRFLADAPVELRNWEWKHFAHRLHDRAVVLSESLPPGTNISYTALDAFDDLLVVSRVLDHPRRIVSAWNIRERRPLLAPTGGYFDSAGPRVARAEGKLVIVEDLRTGASWRLPHADEVRAVGLHPSLPLWVTADVNGVVRYWKEDRPAGECRFPPDDGIGMLIVSPDGRYVAAISSVAVSMLRFGASTPMWKDRTDHMTLPAGFSQTGDYFAKGHAVDPADHRVDLWKCESGDCHAELRGHTQQITSIVFTDRDEYMLSSGRDGFVRIWNPATAELIRELKPRSPQVTQADFDSVTRTVAASGINGEIQCWNIDHGRPVGALQGHTASPESVRFIGGGRAIAAAASDGTIRLWNTEELHDRTVLRGHDRFVYPVAFNSDGSLIASGSWDGTVRVWNAQTHETVHLLRVGENPPNRLFFSPDSTRLMIRHLHEPCPVSVWDINSGRRVGATELLPCDDLDPAFFADDRHVWLPGPPGPTIRVWEVVTDRVSERPVDALQHVSSPAICRQTARALLMNRPSRHMEIVDVTTGRSVSKLEDCIVRACFRRDGRHLATVSKCDTFTFSDHAAVWDAERGTQLARLAEHQGEVFDVIYSPDGTRIVTCGRNGTIRLWDAETFEEVAVLTGHTNYVYSVAFSPDGASLISGSGDATVRLWESRLPSPGPSP